MRTGAVAVGPPTSGERVSSVRLSPDGQILAFTDTNGLLRLWSVRQREAFQTIPAHAAEAWGVAFSPDSSLLATSSDDHTVKIWDAQTRELKATLEGHQSLAAAVAFAPDG